MKTILVTGSSGLIGSEVATYFARLGWAVHGIDNNQREYFLGPAGSTRRRQQHLVNNLVNFHHHEMDVRDRQGVLELVRALRPCTIVHAAAQPSHDRAAGMTFEDFDTNAAGTLNLLEAVRRSCPESPFVFLSSNKVYGDLPNSILLKELDTRWEYDDPAYTNGIPEGFSIDQSTHSLFGVSKLAADLLVQEYGRYFTMPTCTLRCGCLTGPHQAGVELHGFLNYLVKCNLDGREYSIFGYKGKQVRDNIHAEDVAAFIHSFCNSPRSGEVYNLGGGKENSCSIMEAFSIVEEFSGNRQVCRYLDANRVGDHICYYSDLRKIQRHYPDWKITKGVRDIISEIVMTLQGRLP
jgi:CDP-paratose 2-epimerase